MKFKVTVVTSYTSEVVFEYRYYESVQDLIGSLVEGATKPLELRIEKIKEDEDEREIDRRLP